MAENYDVHYDDERFTKVESDKNAALNEMNETYDSMINSTDSFYQAQVDAAKDYEAKQTEIQKANTDFAIEKIEQQKEQAQKDYTKEQAGAYVDWQKQSNQYGANAEAMAANGLTNTGYSETSQAAMYNTYQNRVATARESYNMAVQNYNNAITEARLQNNAALAEIAYQALQTQLELSLQGFQYKNQLIQEQANQKLALDENYYNRYLDVLNQMNTENAMAEQIRQYNESLAEDRRQYDQNYGLQLQQMEESKRQYDTSLAEEIRQYNASLAEDQRQYDQSYILQLQQFEESVRQYEQNHQIQVQQIEEAKRQWEAEYDLQLQQYEENIRQFDTQIKYYKEKDAKNYALEIKQLEMEKDKMEESKRQWEAEMAEEKRQFDDSFAEEQRQYEENMALEREQWEFQKEQAKAKSSGGSGGNTYQLDGDDGGGDNGDDGNPPYYNYNTAIGLVGATANNLISKGASTQEVKDYITLQRQQGNISTAQEKSLKLLLDREK